MELLYHPVSGERMFAYTEDENRIIQAIIKDFNCQLELKSSHRTVRGVL